MRETSEKNSLCFIIFYNMKGTNLTQDHKRISSVYSQDVRYRKKRLKTNTQVAMMSQKI